MWPRTASEKGRLTLSVPKGDRDEAETEFVRTARELYIHTIRKCTGFPKRYTFYISQPMAQMAGCIYEYVMCANSIFPTRKADADLRRQYLTMAHSELRALVAQVEVAAEMFGVRRDGSPYGEIEDKEGHKLDYWMDMVYREIRLVKGVLKRDAQRFKDLPE